MLYILCALEFINIKKRSYEVIVSKKKDFDVQFFSVCEKSSPIRKRIITKFIVDSMEFFFEDCGEKKINCLFCQCFFSVVIGAVPTTLCVDAKIFGRNKALSVR